jgi:hypothetical protein
MMKGLGNSLGLLGIGILLAAALALPVEAQGIHPWQAFFGCWMPAGQGTGDGVLCFRAAGEAAEVSTVVAGEVTSTELLVADGQARTVDTGACTGSKAVEFSSDGRRAFTRSELRCADGTRSSSGVMTFAAPNRWVDLRSIEIGGEHVSWLQEYGPVDREWFVEHAIEDPSVSDYQAVRVRRALAAQPIRAGEVEEAASGVGEGAVQMWVAMQPTEFDLDGDEIVRLFERGVPESVIDVMVASAYPDRFVLSLHGTTTVAEAEPDPAGVPFSGLYRGGYRSYSFDPFFIPGLSPYGPFGYTNSRYVVGSRGFYNYTGYVQAPIVVAPRSPSSQGRMVNGQGYSRNSSSRSARSVDAGSSGTSSGSSVSPAAATGGSSSSGTSTGRTARPRN